MSVNPNSQHDSNKLSAKQRFQSGAAGLGVSSLAMIPEAATGLGAAQLFFKGKDIFIKSERKILPTVQKVLTRYPGMAAFVLAGAGLSAFMEYHSQKLMDKAISGKKAEKSKQKD